MICSALGGKASAMYEGLRLVERLGLSNLLVLSDSLPIIQMLMEGF